MLDTFYDKKEPQTIYMHMYICTYFNTLNMSIRKRFVLLIQPDTNFDFFNNKDFIFHFVIWSLADSIAAEKRSNKLSVGTLKLTARISVIYDLFY